MDALIGGLLLLALVLGFGPATRGTAAAINSFEDPHRQETPEEHARANSDMWRLLLLIIGGFGLAFALKLGAI